MKFIKLYRKSPNILFYLLGLFAFGVFFLLTVWGDDGVFHLVALHNQKNKLAVGNHQVLMENLMLVNQINKLKSPKFIEQSARSELGLVKANETVFLVSE